jgi:hypothetical protein
VWTTTISELHPLQRVSCGEMHAGGWSENGGTVDVGEFIDMAWMSDASDCVTSAGGSGFTTSGGAAEANGVGAEKKELSDGTVLARGRIVPAGLSVSKDNHSDSSSGVSESRQEAGSLARREDSKNEFKDATGESGDEGPGTGSRELSNELDSESRSSSCLMRSSSSHGRGA